MIWKIGKNILLNIFLNKLIENYKLIKYQNTSIISIGDGIYENDALWNLSKN